MRSRRPLLGLLVLAVCILFARNAARLLVVNDPAKSDAILVLAGETDHRPELGLRLLGENSAKLMVLDVPAGQRIYQYSSTELAERWRSGLPDAGRIMVCPIQGLSTKAEVRDAANCLQKISARTVLLVTSDYHTRRALSIFRHELPGVRFSIAAAQGPQEFGIKWWQNREWAKTTLYEWMRLVWWEAVDRWR